MKHSILRPGLVGESLAGIFASRDVEVHIANSRGPASLAAITVDPGPRVVPITLDAALDSDSILFAAAVPPGTSVEVERGLHAGFIHGDRHATES